ncbi:MAG TPA: hypothetical protein VK540_31655 [Polyangiaceae bacterium]|nr:hypothetical protein [Polyangiaceae bacterium]
MNIVQATASPNPGDLIFQTGAGTPPGSPSPFPVPDGSIRFRLADGTEVLRIDPDGTVRVRGNIVDSDKSVYQGFRAWLLHARYTPPAGPVTP